MLKSTNEIYVTLGVTGLGYLTHKKIYVSLSLSLSPHAPSDLRVEENICWSYVGIVRKIRV